MHLTSVVMSRNWTSKPIFLSFLLLSATASLSGCASNLIQGPRNNFPVDDDIKDLRAQFGTAASLKVYYSVTPETAERRNEFIAARLALDDLEFIRYINSLRLSQAQASIAMDSVQLGLGAATTFAGGAHTKAIFGAIITAMTGFNASYQKNFYNDQTSAALVAQMIANRKASLVSIVAGAKESISDYPLTSALTDLANYQMAGTVDGALLGIQNEAALKDAKATNDLSQYRNISFGADSTTQQITKWIWPGLQSIDDNGIARDTSGAAIAPVEDRVKQLQGEITALKLNGLTIEAFLNSQNLANDRKTAIKDLKIP